jgi:tRNA(fMet)-specific endonuclease VapC
VLILDTDAMSVWLDPRDAFRGHLGRRLAGVAPEPRATTVVCFQEQMRGWLAKLHRARTPEQIIREYANLLDAFTGYGAFKVLPYDGAAHARFEDFRRQKIRVPTMDLRIACVTLVNGGTLLTRNVRDFRQVPGLSFEDWSR